MQGFDFVDETNGSLAQRNENPVDIGSMGSETVVFDEEALYRLIKV